jgi:hypothetical protein
VREIENLPRLPNDLEHKVLRGVRARLVRDELLTLGKPQSHDFFHEALELNFTIQRPTREQMSDAGVLLLDEISTRS